MRCHLWGLRRTVKPRLWKWEGLLRSKALYLRRAGGSSLTSLLLSPLTCLPHRTPDGLLSLLVLMLSFTSVATVQSPGSLASDPPCLSRLAAAPWAALLASWACCHVSRAVRAHDPLRVRPFAQDDGQTPEVARPLCRPDLSQPLHFHFTAEALAFPARSGSIGVLFLCFAS